MNCKLIFVIMIKSTFQSFDRKKLSVEDDSGHGGSSETESQTNLSRPETPRERSNSMGSNSGGWIVLGNNPNAEEKTATAAKVRTLIENKIICGKVLPIKYFTVMSLVIVPIKSLCYQMNLLVLGNLLL